MSSIFVLIRPQEWSPAVCDHVRTCITSSGACIDAEDTVPANTLLWTSTLEKYFGGIHYWATSATDAALRHPLSDRSTRAQELSPLCVAEEDFKSLFYQRYGELWDAALDDGRLRTAFTVIKQDNISAAELASRCASVGNDAVLHLPLGVTITRVNTSGRKEFCAQQLYVVNGAYPAELEAFQHKGSGERGTTSSCWWCAASWPSQNAHEESQKTTQRITQLSSTLAKTASTPHGIDIFTGALETAACRMCWMNIPLHYDPFGRMLIQRSLPLPFLETLLRNPMLHAHGHFTSVFDMITGKNEDDAAAALKALYNELRFPDSVTEDGHVVDGAAALYDWQNGYTDLGGQPLESCAEKSIPDRIYAVALVHPRLWSSKKLVNSLQQQLDDLQVRIDATREVFGEELVEKLDLHHGDVARYALNQEALRRFAVEEDKTIASQAMARFEEKCGVSWELAMQEGRVWSASLAENLLGTELATSVLRYCASSAHTTHQLSASLSITELSREVFMTQLNPKCPVDVVSSASDGTHLRHARKSTPNAHRPYSLTSESYFVANAVYTMYRCDLLKNSMIACANRGAAGLWQLSWQHNKRQPNITTLLGDASEELLAAEPGVSASYKSAVTESVCAAYPLLQISHDAFGAMRARHLWWGTSYEDDEVSRDLVRSQGRSWMTLHTTFSESTSEEPTMQEAVLALLPPVAATTKMIERTLVALEENGVVVTEETDLFGADAFEYVSSGSTALAMARKLATRSGAQLWAMMSATMQEDVRAAAAAFAGDADHSFTLDRLYGGFEVCDAMRIPLDGLEGAWQRSKPLCVSENCWLGYLDICEVWVINGHIPVLEHRYKAEAARVHLLRVRWNASAVSWSQMQNALLGPCHHRSEGEGGSASTPAVGSLTRLLSSLADISPSNARRLEGEPLHIFSASTHHALVDVLRWPRAGSCGPLSSEVALEDWLLKQPSVQNLLLRGTATLSIVVQQVRETVETALPSSLPLQRPLSSPPYWMLRFGHSQRAEELHHGFIWLHPSSTTPEVREAVPQLLLAHGVGVRESGVVPLEVALEGQLLDVLHDSFFKNAYIRKASEVPITDSEARAFAHHFDMDWIKAVQLGLVLNAKEAEQKYGTVHMLIWWDSLTPEHQVKLSDSLFVGYMAKEGLYVMNVPYTYRRSRLHAGSHEVVWYAVEWRVERMSWDNFMMNVIGAADPDTAAVGSLRQNFATHWTQYSLPGKPDEIECVLHASESPLAALAERCRWLAQSPVQDPYGRLLLQSGVSQSLLTTLLSNPSVYNRSTGLIMSAFHMFPREDTHELVLQLRNAQCTRTVVVLPDTTRFVPPSTVHTTPASLFERISKGVGEDEEDQGSLAVLEELSAFYNMTLASGTDPFIQCGFATAHSHDLSSPSPLCRNFAVLYLDPTCTPEVPNAPLGHRAFCTLLEQQLRINGFRVVHERLVQCASAAEASVLYRSHHHRQYRYGVAIPATESLRTSMRRQLRFKEQFGVFYQHSSVCLYNAAEMSQTMKITEREVASLCRRSHQQYPRDTVVMDEGCVIQKLHPGKPHYVMNGDAMEAEREFVAAQATAGVQVWMLTWDSAGTDMGYGHLKRLIADLQGPAGVLRQWLASGGGEEDLGLASKPSTADWDSPILHVSESSIAAVRERQLWWRLPVWSDPTVAMWTKNTGEDEAKSGKAVVTPLCALTVAWALGDPLVPVRPQGDTDPVYLWDTAMGMNAGDAYECIRRCWAAHVTDNRNEEEIRNTAVVTLAPQVAANNVVGHLVRSVLLEKGLRIDSHGFLADHGEDALTLKRFVQYLYPEDWRYSNEEPSDIQLNAEEAERFAQTFGASWGALLNKSQLLPASWATKRLGGMTAPHLRLFVNMAQNSLWVRPHLHVAQLKEYGVYVINAHIPYLAHMVAATITQHPLPYYVVSWSPSLWNWKECLTEVFGHSEPALAAPGSIRGRLYASWPALSLHASPERAEVGGGGGVCVSEGPVESLFTRLHVEWPPLDWFDSDTVGSYILQQQDAPNSLAVLRTWLRNPVVTCDGNSTGVFSHLSFWDTREVVQFARALAVGHKEASASEAPVLPALLLEARDELRKATARQAAQAAWERVVQRRYNLPALCAPSKASVTPTDQLPDNAAESEMLYRNNATLLFFSNRLDATQRAQLRHHLLQYGVAVTTALKCEEEEEQECTAALLDRLYATEAFFSDCHNLASVLAERGEVTVDDQARFNAVFRDEVPWVELLARSAHSEEGHDAHTAVGDSASNSLHQRKRIYSAADAMKIWNLTPQQLWAEVRQGVSMQLSEALEVTCLPCTGRGDTGDVNGCAAVSETNTPWGGHYVVNGLYAAVRAHLQVPATIPDASGAFPAQTPPHMSKWNVTWDARSLSWEDFCQNVIGCSNCAQAASSSFNAFLAKSPSSVMKTQESSQDEVPSPISCLGIMAASGPLAAFAVRRYWSWNATHHDVYLPDPFLRAVVVAGMDHDVVLDEGWLLNPITVVTPRKRMRLFEWTRGCDTLAVLHWMYSCEQMPNGACTEATKVNGARHAAEENSHDSKQCPDKDAVSPAAKPERPPPTPPPRLKTHLRMAWVHDALLHARTDAEYQALWEHYRSLSAAKAGESAVDGEAAPKLTISNTIPFALFYRDFKSLDRLGVRCISQKLKHLFIDIETRRRGCMSYAELTHALSLYHSL